MFYKVFESLCKCWREAEGERERERVFEKDFLTKNVKSKRDLKKRVRNE